MQRAVSKNRLFSLLSSGVLFAIVSLSGVAQAKDASQENLKLYAFDCGTINVSDMDVFSSTGDYANQQQEMSGTCYLVRHENGDLLWDTGLSASLVDNEPAVNGVFTLSMNKTLVEQLSTISVTPADIEFLSISHSHFDHTGQMASFTDSTWLVHEAEFNHISSASDLQALYSEIESMPRKKFNGDYDVFGDGSVKIIAMPGHTPGHTVLQVNLKNTGPVLLSGDLYHQAKSRELKRVPRFNVDEPMTRESIEKFEEIVSKLSAKVIIQHEKTDTDQLPKLPNYLD